MSRRSLVVWLAIVIVAIGTVFVSAGQVVLPAGQMPVDDGTAFRLHEPENLAHNSSPDRFAHPLRGPPPHLLPA